MRKPLTDILTEKGIPFVVDHRGRVWQIPAGGEGDDAAEGDDPPAEGDTPDPIAALDAKWEQRFRDQERTHTESMHQMGNRLAEVTGAYNALAASTNAGNKVEAPVIEDVSEDAIAKALEDGDYKLAAQLTKKAAKAEAKRETSTFRETEFNPLVNTVQNVGLPAMTNLANHQVMQGLSPAAREFYQKNKAAVDAHFAKVPPEGRVDPNAIIGALAYEMGLANLNGGLESTIEAEVERRLRSANQPGGPKINGRDGGGPREEIDWEKVFGAGAAAAAEEMGGWDAVAQRWGYATMDEYAKKTGVIGNG